MAEQITIDAEMPKGYEKLNGLEISQNGDDLSVAGIILLGEDDSQFQRSIDLQYDPREMWGYSNEDRELPKPKSKVQKAAAKVVDLAASAAAGVKDKVTPTPPEADAEPEPAAAEPSPAKPSAPETGTSEENDTAAPAEAETATITEAGESAAEAPVAPELSDEMREFIRQEVERQVEAQVAERTKVLQDKNDQLEAENKKLDERIKQLEDELKQAKEAITEPTSTPAEPTSPETDKTTPEQNEDEKPVEALKTDGSPKKSLKDRAKKLLSYSRFLTPVGWMELKAAHDAKSQPEPAESEQESEKTKKRRIGGAVGVLAVGALMVGSYLYGRHTGHNPLHEAAQAVNPPKGANADHTKLIHTKHELADAKHHIQVQNADIKHLKQENHHLLNEIHAHGHGGHAAIIPGNNSLGPTHTESLQRKGDTVWSHVANYVQHKTGRRPSAKFMQRVLQLNGLREHGGPPGVDVHNLPVGQRFKIPNNVS